MFCQLRQYIVSVVVVYHICTQDLLFSVFQIIGIVFSFSLAGAIRKAKNDRERRRWEIQERVINAYTSLNPNDEKNPQIVYVPFQGQTVA